MISAPWRKVAYTHNKYIWIVTFREVREGGGAYASTPPVQ